MKHTCYHILSDLHDQFCNSIDEVKISTEKWEKEGDGHFKVFRICTEEQVDSDEIILDEELISLDEIRKN